MGIIDQNSCKNILNEQQNIMQSNIKNGNKYKSIIQTQKSINLELTAKFDELNKKTQTFQDMAVLLGNNNNDKENHELTVFKQELESIKRLTSIKKLVINSDELLI